MAEVVGGGVSTVHFFHADQVGTTRAVTDANGNNLASCAQNSTYPNGSFLTYSPFGTPMDCTQSATAYMFTSKEQDAESSLDHFRYRKSPRSSPLAHARPGGHAGALAMARNAGE